MQCLTRHPEVPHEPTSDQWFDEAQFESYRRLGLHAVNRVSLGDQLDLEHLFARAARQHRHAPREVGKSQTPTR